MPFMPIARSLGWKLALLAAALLLVASGIAIFGLWRVRTDQAARLSRLEGDNRLLQGRAQTAERAVAALRQGLPVPVGPRIETPRDARTGNINALDQAKMLIQFREQLAAANRSVEFLQTRLQEVQFTLEKVTEENKRLASSESDLKERVGAANRVLEAVQTELKGKDNRLAELDAAYRRLRDENRVNADKASQIPRALQDLEQINRRREGVLTGILRRYRDITDQYRSLAARLDRESSSPGASELGGIQNAISMTDEDLRQLSNLNAQAIRIQQKLSGK
jgi:chromosome segregation ATPase